MTRNLVVGLVIALLIAAVALLASPLLGLQSLRDALASRDAGKLAELIDAEALRTNLGARVRARYRQAEGKLPMEPVIERLVTAQGLIAAICDGGSIGTQSANSAQCDVHSGLDDFRFESTDRYSAALTQGDRIAATVVMDRVGLHWRLVDLVLPAAAYDQLKNSVLN